MVMRGFGDFAGVTGAMAAALTACTASAIAAGSSNAISVTQAVVGI